ncbi:MAG TPA: YARHG domain-containing protein [Candidatus Blautia avistercoris]|nr:YARHG domain-containing protein [Candidatus Blautia avistercoris]
MPTPIPTATPTPAPSPSVLPTPTPGITGTPTPTPAAAGGDYILPESSSRYLTREEVSGLNYEQKQMAINEIYARHGYRFTMKEVQDYFNQKSWYQGTVDPANFSESVFNQYEAANIQLLNQ